MNQSKAKDPRFWRRWDRCGATHTRIDPTHIVLLETAWDQDRDPVGIWTELPRALQHINFPTTSVKTYITPNGSLLVKGLNPSGDVVLFVVGKEAWEKRIPSIVPSRNYVAQESEGYLI